MQDEEKLPPGSIDRILAFDELLESSEFMQMMQKMRDTREQLMLKALKGNP